MTVPCDRQHLVHRLIKEPVVVNQKEGHLSGKETNTAVLAAQLTGAFPCHF